MLTFFTQRKGEVAKIALVQENKYQWSRLTSQKTGSHKSKERKERIKVDLFASTPKCCHKKVTAYTDDDDENIHQQQLHKNSVSILPPTIIKFIHNFYPCTSPANVYAPPENRSLQIIQYIDFFLEYLQIYIGKNNEGIDSWTSIYIIILSLFRKYLKCFQISMWPMCRHSLLHSLVQVPSDQ